MARRSKAQIALENRISAACQNACNGKSIDIMKLGEVSKAAEAAAAAGGDVEAAAEAKAAELHNPR